MPRKSSTGLARLLAKRARERERLIQEARAYAKRVRAALPDARVYLYGSVARGNFHDKSDIDLVVVSKALPENPFERPELLYRFVEGREEPKGLRPEELGKAWWLEDAIPL